jgi:hypothetical protein
MALLLLLPAVAAAALMEQQQQQQVRSRERRKARGQAKCQSHKARLTRTCARLGASGKLQPCEVLDVNL